MRDEVDTQTSSTDRHGSTETYKDIGVNSQREMLSRRHASPYEMPESWRTLNANLRQALARDCNDLEIASTWQAFLLSLTGKLTPPFALSAGGGTEVVASIIIEYFKPPEVVQIHQDSLREISDLVQQALAQSEHDRYKRWLESCRGKLLVYAESNDPNLLDNAFFDLFESVYYFRDLGIAAAGAFVLAANCHLTALLAKAEHISDYMTTFNRVRGEYAGHATGLCNLMRERFSFLANAVQSCNCRQNDQRPVFYQCRCNQVGNTSAFAAEMLYGPFGQEDPGNAAKRDEVLSKCNGVRAEFIHNRFLDLCSKGLEPILEAIRRWSS